MNERIYRIIKIVLAIILLVILYLIALNGRYETIGSSPAAIDKWKGCVVLFKQR